MSSGPLQGIVSYPGLAWGNSFTRAEYTASHGISAGQCVIEMPQQNVALLAQQGDVTFSYGSNSFTLYDCVVDQVNTGTSQNGYIARVVILDRRWRWHPVKAGGYVNGHFNLPMPGGATNTGGFDGQPAFDQPTLRPGTEMAPQDLASQCLSAMGEQSFDVSVLPNDARPEVHWSYQNPAEALNQICDQLGCRIVLNLEENAVQIVAIGEGEPLPIDGTVEFPAVGANPPEVPGSLLFVGGATIFQDYLSLEAVGIDLDGTIRPIDDLSYAPVNRDTGSPDWTHEPPNWPSLDDGQAKALATRWLYRLWRLSMPYTGAFMPDGQSASITRIDQIHLYDRRIDTWVSPDDATQLIVGKPELWGTFDQAYAQNYGTSAEGAADGSPSLYAGEATVDADRGLVVSEHPLYYSDDDGLHPASGLAVNAAFSLHDPDTWEPLRYTRQRTLDADGGTGPRIVRREDVVRKLYVASGQSNDQSDELDQKADFYLDYAQAQYIQQDTLDVSYADLKLLQPDGLTQQVTWSIECPGGGTKTRASLATEHNPYVPRYRTRRQIESDSRRAFSDPSAAVTQQWKTAGVFPGGGVW
jgi:hypothetical protein